MNQDTGVRKIGLWNLLAIPVCVAFSLGLWGLERSERQATLDRAYALTRTAVDVTRARAEGVLAAVDQMLIGVADFVALQGGLPEALGPDMQLFLDSRAARQPLADSLVVVDASGRLVAHSGLPNVPALDLSFREFFQRAKSGHEHGLLIGRPLRTRTTETEIIPVVRPIYEADGTFNGMVGVGIDPVALLGVMPGPAEEESGGAVTVLREDGIVLARRPNNAAFLGEDVSRGVLFDSLLRQADAGSHDTISPLDGARRILSYTRAADGLLVTVVSRSRDAVLARHRDNQWPYVIVGVLGNALLLTLFELLRRQVQRRRRAVDDLFENRTELARLNRTLEARVAARTRELKHSEARSRAFMNAAHDAVVVFNDDGQIVEFNPAATRVFGYSEEEVPRVGFTDLVPQYRTDAPEDATGQRSDGTRFPAEVWSGRLEDIDGGAAGGGHTFYIIRNISRRKRAEAQLVALATTDPLTGALNRRALQEATSGAVSLAHRHGRPLSVLMIDADHFKAINDTHGHNAGDAVLKHLVETVGRVLRETDILGRLGGEEFVAVLPETDSDGAIALAHRILSAVRTTEAEHAGKALRITVSIGVAMLAPEESGIDGAFKRADDALYTAKQRGRDRAVVADMAEA